jgi:hypothetical protein
VSKKDKEFCDLFVINMNRLEDLSGSDLPGMDNISCPIGKISVSQPWGRKERDASFEKRKVGSPIKNGTKADLRDDCTLGGGVRMDLIHPMAYGCSGAHSEVAFEAGRIFNTDIKSTLFGDAVEWPTSSLPSNGSIHKAYEIPAAMEKCDNTSDSSLKVKSLQSPLPSRGDSHDESDESTSLQNLLVRHRSRRKGKARRTGNQVLLPTSFGIRSLRREIELRTEDEGSLRVRMSHFRCTIHFRIRFRVS